MNRTARCRELVLGGPYAAAAAASPAARVEILGFVGKENRFIKDGK